MKIPELGVLPNAVDPDRERHPT